MNAAKIGAAFVVLVSFAGHPTPATAQGFDGRWQGDYACGAHALRPEEQGPFAWKRLAFNISNGAITGRHDYINRRDIAASVSFNGRIDRAGNIRIDVISRYEGGQENFHQTLIGRAATAGAVELTGPMLGANGVPVRNCQLTLSISAPQQPLVARAAPVPTPQPAKPAQAQPQPTPVFVIFFNNDSDEIEANGQLIISQAMDVWWQTKGKGGIRVTGYTDRSLAPDQSQQLSEQRAQNVADVLARLGVPQDRLFVEGRGENQPRIPTEPGVKEPQNQRVDLVVLSEKETVQAQKQREQEAKTQPAPAPAALPDVPHYSVGSVAPPPAPEPPAAAPPPPAPVAAAPPAPTPVPAPAASAPPMPPPQPAIAAPPSPEPSPQPTLAASAPVGREKIPYKIVNRASGASSTILGVQVRLRGADQWEPPIRDANGGQFSIPSLHNGTGTLSADPNHCQYDVLLTLDQKVVEIDDVDFCAIDQIEWSGGGVTSAYKGNVRMAQWRVNSADTNYGYAPTPKDANGRWKERQSRSYTAPANAAEFQRDCTQDDVYRSCRLPEAAEALRVAMRKDFDNGLVNERLNDPNFKQYCADPLATYRPQKGFAGIVVHEYSPFNGVRILYSSPHHVWSTKRIYFKVLLAFLEGDNVHYQLAIVNCFLPKTAKFTGTDRWDSLSEAEKQKLAKEDADYEKFYIGDGVAIDAAGDTEWNHELIEVIQEKYMSDRQPDTELWVPLPRAEHYY